MIGKEIEKKNFDFVDTIRCISMIGIVFEHSTTLAWFKYPKFWDSFLQASVIQVFKFSTIAFFLIAGFLINHKFAEYTPYQYLRNRFRNTIGPWAFWLNVFILINLINLFVRSLKGGMITELDDGFINYLGAQYYNVLFATSFWFILNFLICIAILLAFKKYLYDIWFGAILFLLSIFYSINMYYSWGPVGHTTALFGFVFYLWLGAYANKHYGVVSAFIKKMPMIWFVISVVITLIINILEVVHFKSIRAEGAYNTLAASNIIYSICFFAFLLKIGPINFINKQFQPRKTTFGIYLLHHIVLTYLITEIFRPFHIPLDNLTVYNAIAYSVIRFVCAYSISMLIVRIILKTRFRWAIGG
jgi:membrane-bound acyltransferase YfiQ involved in biofilm formation